MENITNCTITSIKNTKFEFNFVLLKTHNNLVSGVNIQINSTPGQFKWLMNRGVLRHVLPSSHNMINKNMITVTLFSGYISPSDPTWLLFGYISTRFSKSPYINEELYFELPTLILFQLSIHNQNWSCPARNGI